MKAIYLLPVLAVMTACSGKVGSTGTEDNTDAKSEAQDSIVVSDDQTTYDEEEEGSTVSIYKSSDGVVTMESDMCPGGGTAPEYWTRWRFKSKKGHDCEVYIDNGAAGTGIITIKKSDGSTYYLVKFFSKASSSDGYEWLEAYKIDGDTIREVSIVDGGKNVGTGDDFSVNYCIPDWYFATYGAGYGWMFEYDPATANLYVPLELDASVSLYQLSDRYTLWHFDGQRFVNKGEVPHKDLYPSLAEYVRLIQYLETKDYIVRVDELADRQLRYASWKKPKTMKDKPDVVIVGGEKKSHEVPPSELQPCSDFRFKNDGYEYAVNYCEVGRDKGGIGWHHDYLLVTKNGKTVLKQEVLK